MAPVAKMRLVANFQMGGFRIDVDFGVGVGGWFDALACGSE